MCVFEQIWPHVRFVLYRSVYSVMVPVLALSYLRNEYAIVGPLGLGPKKDVNNDDEEK